MSQGESSEGLEYWQENPQKGVEPTKLFNTREIQVVNECGLITKRAVFF